MKTIIQSIVRLRNPAFHFDPELRLMLIISFAYKQFCAMLRGFRVIFYFKKPNKLMLGKGVKFFNVQQIKWGSYLKLGDGVFLSALGKRGISFGNNVGIGSYSQLVVSTSFNQIGLEINIGNNVGIGEFAYLGGAGGLTIGNDCIVGQYFSCHPENHNFNDLHQCIREQGITRNGITIGNNCWIGSKVTVLDGVTLGNGCVVAAGAVVTKSFAANSIIAGVPAKLIKVRN